MVTSFTRPLGPACHSVLRCAQTQQLDGVLGEDNVAYTAMSGYGTAAHDHSPLQTAVWRLRSRGCWVDAAALLEPHARHDAKAALHRAALLIERCLYTERGWTDAEDALRTAEALAGDDEARGAAACERGQLGYASTLLGARDRADEARAAMGRAAALLAPGTSGRPLLDFRRGLIAQNLSHSAQSARAAFRRAHAGATAHGQTLLLSCTWRHLASRAARGRAGGGAARVHGVPADTGGTGLSGRYGAGLGFAGTGRARAGGQSAAGRGSTAVPAAQRGADMAGLAVDAGATA